MDTNNIKIQAACENDAELLVKLSAQTFSETYSHAHSKEDMSTYIRHAFTKEKFLRDMRGNGIVLLIAATDDTAVGYVRLRNNKKPPEIKDSKSIELVRLYVLKEMIGQGIGKKLLIEALEIVKNKGHEMVWLAVWEHNPDAISFYRQLGFKNFGTSIFTLGKVKRNLLLMKKDL